MAILIKMLAHLIIANRIINRRRSRLRRRRKKPQLTNWGLVAPWSHPRPAEMTDFITTSPRYLMEVASGRARPWRSWQLEGIYVVLTAGQQALPWRGSGLCILLSATFWEERDKVILKVNWEFPGGPVVRTPSFHCWGRGFSPWSGN